MQQMDYGSKLIPFLPSTCFFGMATMFPNHGLIIRFLLPMDCCLAKQRLLFLLHTKIKLEILYFNGEILFQDCDAIPFGWLQNRSMPFPPFNQDNISIEKDSVFKTGLISYHIRIVGVKSNALEHLKPVTDIVSERCLH